MCLGLKLLRPGAKEMASWLRAFAVLAEDQGVQFQHPHGGLRPVSGDLMPLSDLHRQAGGTHTHRHRSKTEKKINLES